MKALVACVLLLSCGGSPQRPVAESPTGRTRRPPSLAPPASGDDKERYQLNQQFEDMRDAQEANREVDHANAAAGAGSGSAAPEVKRPIKRGPAEQAPSPPPSK
jgi:hypothetical protein